MTEPAGRATAGGDMDARSAMWEMITGYRVSQVVRVAAALSLAEHCEKGPVTAKIVATEEDADLIAVSRFLRACASIGLVESADEVNFTSTPLLRAAPGHPRVVARLRAVPAGPGPLATLG